ncbi:MAG: orotate phosphoribosyltransferase [Candidatus Parcubacteria bacterium]|jgi:orotate phosphoribosyltransferase|nr:orotate phosphoribosyltransferase [Candidatus Parcubacteria bacterium]
MHRDENGWLRAYQDLGALWIHDGNPRRPHALLTSGQHSNGFFNSKLVIEDKPLLNLAAQDLVELIDGRGEILCLIDRVVGPQTGATDLAELIAHELGCSWSSPAKSGEGEERTMVFSQDEAKAIYGDSVLLCEDVITTGGSVNRAATAITGALGDLLPYVAVLVNRSGLEEVDGRKIIALVTRHLPIWAAEECPLCAQGSEAIRPKESAENWGRLNAHYD